MDNYNSENEDKKKLLKLYEEMGNELIDAMRQSDVDPSDVAYETGITPEYMLNVLIKPDNGEYLAYRSINSSIKKLSRKLEERKKLEQ